MLQSHQEVRQGYACKRGKAMSIIPDSQNHSVSLSLQS